MVLVFDHRRRRRLRNMGRIRLRNGRITPEDLREDWNAYAGELSAGDGGVVVPHPRPRLVPTPVPAPALGGGCAPIVMRIPDESGGGSQVFPRAAREGGEYGVSDDSSLLRYPNLLTANRVLATFVDARIERRRGGMYVCWAGKARRWQCYKGNDFFPTWFKCYPGGGTSTTALSQLIRWLQCKPVLPIATWALWAGTDYLLLPVAAVEVLKAAGYPHRVDCVLCGQQIHGGLDWWSLDGVSGPCCGWMAGCRQRIPEEL